jgi:hypothetical protein
MRFLRSIRPTHFHADPHLQSGVGEDGIPFRDLTVSPPLQGDRPGAVKHAHQRSSTPTAQMLSQSPDQGFHRFVLHPRDAEETRVLQAGSKEADSTDRAVDELHIDLPEVVLTEFSRQTFETDQRLNPLGTQRGDQGYNPVLPPR